ncbi:MAG: TVP38/TMEM64 family protein [Rubellimicrobium sp.]|nr:TVP38/TMEM64 family protein [Rubellimicrobium sp.]
MAAGAFGWYMLRDVEGLALLRDNREAMLAFRDANLLIAISVFMAGYVLVAALSVPGATFVTLTGGFLFGVFPGVLFNVTAATLGATILFLAARTSLGDRLAARMDASEGKVRKLKEGIDENQWSMLFVMRLLPVVPFFIANLVPAVVGVSLLRFAVSTFFGIMPGALVFTSVGAGLGEVIAAGESPDLGVIFSPPVLLPLLGLAALSLLPVLAKALRVKGSA